jgi:hypothetical protein
MATAELQTKKTGESVEAFLNSVADEQRRADSFRVLEMMRSISGAEPEMWGPAIIGFGSRPLKYASGREIEWMDVAFSPRKANLTLYLTEGFEGYDELLTRLGKHKVSKACLYIKRLSDVDEKVLRELIAASIDDIRSKD